MKFKILNLILIVFICTPSFAALKLEDDGVHQGYVNQLDVTGALQATASGIKGTITYGGGGSLGDITTTSINNSDGNITNVGDISLDSISGDADAITIGDGADTVAINSSDWDINVTGDATGMGSITADATIQAEQLTSTDDADIADNLTAGDIIIDESAGVLDFTGVTSATISATVSGLINLDDPIEVNGSITSGASSQPTVSYKDSDSIDDVVNADTYGDLTDTGSGTEDCDKHHRQQIAGTLTDYLFADADGPVTIGSATQNTTVAGDLTINGDDLFMTTNTTGFILVADNTNYNPVDMNGDVDIDSAGTTTIQANSVALGTDTTGNYVTSITNGTYITGGDGGSESAALTLDVQVAKDIVAGTGLSGGANDVLPGADSDVTLDIDTTEIDATTWSDGVNASNIWTFNVSGTDHTMTAGDGLMTLSHNLEVSGTANFSGHAAFDAKVTSTITNVTGNGTAYDIVFATERKDINSNYNNATGIFTSPVNGFYIFTYTVGMTDLTGSAARGQLNIVTSNGSVGKYDIDWGGLATASTNLSVAGSAVIYLDASDTAKVTVDIAGEGADTIDILAASYFSGFLLTRV